MNEEQRKLEELRKAGEAAMEVMLRQEEKERHEIALREEEIRRRELQREETYRRCVDGALEMSRQEEARKENEKLATAHNATPSGKRRNPGWRLLG